MEHLKRRHKRVISFLAGVFVLFLLSYGRAAEAGMVELDADRIVYDDESGTATAEGSAILSYEDVKIYADRIDYDDAAGRVSASSVPEKGVTLTKNQQLIKGEKLDYDLNTSEGVLSGARSAVAVDGRPVYVYGDNLEAIPYHIAEEKKLVRPGGSADGGYVIKWDNVSLTTCTLEHPHYRLEAKRFVFIPGRRVIVKRPRLYLGERYIFTYPLDYIINVSREQRIKTAILPNVSFQSSKGTGVGISGPVAWDTGGVGLSAMYWSDIGFEWSVALEQKIGRDFTFYGELDYSWDRMWDEKKYRPDLSLRYDRPNWFAQLSWRKNQYTEVQKNADYQYRGELYTSPEIMIGSPWLQGGDVWYRFSAMWGRYEASAVLENGREVTEPWRARFKIAADSYWESNWGWAVPFLNMNAASMIYDEDSARQDVVNSVLGLKYSLGGVKLGTAYSRSWVSGETSMSWDREFENEKIYQMAEIPIGRNFSLNVLGGYDLNASFVEEMNYTLRYTTDCMVWELAYRNDRNFGGENKVFFRVGFTGTSVEFKNEEIVSPFDNPVTQNPFFK